MKLSLTLFTILLFSLGCSSDNDTTQDVVATASMKKDITPRELYAKKCAACHGYNARKSALGESRHLAELSKEQILLAINGYRDRSYGGEKKELMYSQLKALNDKQIASLITYIKAL